MPLTLLDRPCAYTQVITWAAGFIVGCITVGMVRQQTVLLDRNHCELLPAHSSYADVVFVSL